MMTSYNLQNTSKIQNEFNFEWSDDFIGIYNAEEWTLEFIRGLTRGRNESRDLFPDYPATETNAVIYFSHGRGENIKIYSLATIYVTFLS